MASLVKHTAVHCVSVLFSFNLYVVDTLRHHYYFSHLSPSDRSILFFSSSEKLSAEGTTCLLNGTIPGSTETTPIPRAVTPPTTTTEVTPDPSAVTVSSSRVKTNSKKKNRKKKRDKWEIDPNTIVTEGHIGSGSFGEVHKGNVLT